MGDIFSKNSITKNIEITKYTKNSDIIDSKFNNIINSEFDDYSNNNLKDGWGLTTDENRRDVYSWLPVL